MADEVIEVSKIPPLVSIPLDKGTIEDLVKAVADSLGINADDIDIE